MYRASCSYAPGELRKVHGNADDIHSAAGKYLNELNWFIKRGGRLCEVTEADMRSAHIRGISIRDKPFLTSQFRYPAEVLDHEEFVHFFEANL